VGALRGVELGCAGLHLNTKEFALRTRFAVAGVASLVASLVLAVSVAGSAQALASSRWPFRIGGSSTIYYFYGNDSVTGGLATATTTVGGTACLLHTRSVSTSLRLPNGSHASHSSLLGQCAASINIARGQYSAFQISSTHTLNLWNGQTWSYVD
jgi:hypothetical protein